MKDTQVEYLLGAAEEFIDGLYQRLMDADTLVLAKTYFYGNDPTTDLEYTVTTLRKHDLAKYTKHLDVSVFNNRPNRFSQQPNASRELVTFITFSEREKALDILQQIHQAIIDEQTGETDGGNKGRECMEIYFQRTDFYKKYEERIQWLETKLYRLQYSTKHGWPDDYDY